MRSLFAPLAALGICIAAAPAQDEVLKGTAPSGLVRTMNNNDNSIAATVDGMLWTVVYEMDGQGGNGHLELRRSITHGTLWLSTDKWPLPNNTSHNNHHNNSGCIVAGRDPQVLHVAWADKTADPNYWSAMYQAFDTKNLTWIGTPTVLAKGYAANNQFWPVDIAMTEKGTLAVCISGHRRGGLGLGTWDCGLAIKKRGGSFNSTLINLRSGGPLYSQNAGIVAVEETIHCCMKGATGGYGIAYRSYDTEADAWDQTTQVQIGPSNNASIAAGNKSVIAADSNGGIYILYVTGNASRPRTLRVAYAAPGMGGVNTDWKDITIIPDTATVGTNYRNVASNNGAYPLIQGGNSTYRNYSLSPIAGGGMGIIYSKAFEVFESLYVQIYEKGNSILPETKTSPPGTKPYAFEWVSGFRNSGTSFVATWVTYGKTDAPSPNNGPYPNGVVQFWRLGNGIARTIAYGTGCQGSLPEQPRIQADDTRPALGMAYKLNLDRFPASAGFFAAVGVAPAIPALNLGFMGAPQCQLDTTFPLIVQAAVGSDGKLTLTWNVPNDNTLTGVPIFAQCLVFAPGANAGGVVTTNAIAAILGQ